MLRRSRIEVAGKEAVVVGRSDIVGKPMAMLLLNANATVTVCHSKTPDLPAVCRRADILVAAIGRAAMITRDFVRPGATVIDVGMNKVTDRAEFERFFKGNEKREQAFAKNGSTLVGDVHPEVAEIAGAITPVPGGVGPLTIAMLMANTVRAAKLRRRLRLRSDRVVFTTESQRHREERHIIISREFQRTVISTSLNHESFCPQPSSVSLCLCGEKGSEPSARLLC